MYKERSGFELSLELLYQVNTGRWDEDSLLRCTNLTTEGLERALEPLLSGRLLKKTSERHSGKSSYVLTDMGERFLDFVGFELIHSENCS